MLKRAVLCITLLSTTFMCYPQDTKVETIVDSYIKDKRPVGLVVGIVDNGKVQFITRGETAKGNQQPPDENTVFEAGYITQLYTSSLLSILNKKEIALLDDQLQDYLPDSVRVPTYQDIICGIDQFAEHHEDDPIPIFVRSICVPCYPRKVRKRSDDPFTNYTVNDLYQHLPKYKLYSAPGQEFEFSLLGIALLGQAMANKMEMDYEALIITELLQALDMHDTRITLNYDQRARYAQGHKKRGKPVEPWGYQAMAPAGAFRSTGADLVKFLKANLGLMDTDLAEALKVTHQPRVIADLPDMPHSKIGMGWKISGLQQSGHEMRWTDSRTAGSSGFLGFVKETKTGIVILSNSDVQVKTLGTALLKELHATPKNRDTTAR